ncbi:hypothetical protein PVAP13_8NG293568 [Panicum virgatum]|uniref:Uncharacterized protein n=1 Tax=Panicum virgatum TaxID=38727 RepID=A0A8T0PE60_PANVG|nr:hypothetical protein PVAP13_8NG293568 [Panicum virgatum]
MFLKWFSYFHPHQQDIPYFPRQVKDEVTTLSRKDIKSLTQTYTGNTFLEAILIATITFAAACFSLAMCSSLAVAFICVIHY